MRRKTAESVLESARHELALMIQKVYDENENLKQKIIEKYPPDYYGIKWVAIYETKSKNNEQYLKNCRKAMIALENTISLMKEGRL